jgi:hypothetical protein
MWFADDVSATLSISAFRVENTCTIHLMGTHGEIFGNFNEQELTVANFRRRRRWGSVWRAHSARTQRAGTAADLARRVALQPHYGIRGREVAPHRADERSLCHGAASIEGSAPVFLHPDLLTAAGIIWT